MRSRLMLQERQAGVHPDAGVLAAFAEQRLSRGEQGEVWSHLAHCPECRAILGSACAADENEMARARRAARSGWWTWRWVAAGAAACLIASVIMWRPAVFREPATPTRATVEKRSSMPVQNGPLQSSPRPSSTTDNEAAASKGAEHAAKSPPQAVKQSVAARNAEVAPTTPPSESHFDVIAGAQAVAGTPAPQQLVTQAPASADLILPQTALRPNFDRPVKAFMPETTMTGSTLWSLDASRGGGEPGTIERSGDGGKTWHSVLVDSQSRFYALSSHGNSIWVGGAEGALFHSSDGGRYWARVAVGNEDGRVKGAITQITARSAESVQVKIAREGDWVTIDGGLHWRRE